MSVIRVGFVLGEIGWIGGANYFRNLFSAIQSLPNPKIQPVVFTGLKSDATAFEGLAEIIRTPILDRKSISWILYRMAVRMLPSRNYVLYWILRKHHIDLMSHVGELWQGCSIRSIGWIPDFQHIHLPQFFIKQEIIERDSALLNRISQSNAILLSSEDGLNDLKSFCPQSITPTYVLRFISCLLQEQALEVSKSVIQSKHGLNRPWFHVPNQFWAHKNHDVVIEALNILKQKNKDILVVSTGSISDHRNPEYFNNLKMKINLYGLDENFRILGVLPYPEVVSLMRYSVAVINPSLFEGWSTTVEEAKSLGKVILLSDIPVHREQSPERAGYFNPNQANDLAEKMIVAQEEFDPVYEEKVALTSYQYMEERKREFAINYERIVFQVHEKTGASLEKDLV